MTNITHIQWHIGDFLGGVMQMDGAEIGAYTMMIVAHYQAGLEGLSSDDKDLMLITRTNPKVWHRIKVKVLKKFTLVDGRYIHERIVEELNKIHDRSGPGRPRKDDVGYPKSFDEKTTSDTQLKNKPLEIKETEKTTLKPKTYNQEPLRKEKIKKENFEFEEFWNLCPRKVGKGKAEEKYWIARDEVSHAELITAMKAHAKECVSKDREFIPHPATWLFQKRYFDETPITVIETAKKDWPDWKIAIAAELGDHVVKSWFSTAEKRGTVLNFQKKFDYDKVRNAWGIDLKRMGITEIVMKQGE
jgi:uncharacterized protein YdaU (DUF1376 family)